MTLIRGAITGLVIGVILSVVLNSWAFMAVGIAFGAILGGMPLLGGRPNTGAPDRTTRGADERTTRGADEP